MPDVGFIKQQVVEITDEGVVRDTFPLTEEIESVEWMPGVIVLLSESQVEEIKNKQLKKIYLIYLYIVDYLKFAHMDLLVRVT